MSATTLLPARTRTGLESVARFAIIALVGLILGGLTSLGQSLLPAEFSSLANSSTGWTIPTLLLVFFIARGYLESAAGGAGAFVALTIGYALISTWRGYYFDPSMWAIVGVVAGPIMGADTAALKRGPREVAAGTAVIAGVFVGEGYYGLTVIGETTSPACWWVMIAFGVTIIVWSSFRLRKARLIVLTAGASIAVAALVPLGNVALLFFI